MVLVTPVASSYVVVLGLYKEVDVAEGSSVVADVVGCSVVATVGASVSSSCSPSAQRKVEAERDQ